MTNTPARDALSPRQRWGTCCPNDPECDHSLMDVDILARYMDTPLSDLEAVMVEAGWGKDVVWDIRRHPDLVLAALCRERCTRPAQGHDDLNHRLIQALHDEGAFCGNCNWENALDDEGGCTDCVDVLTKYSIAAMATVVNWLRMELQ